MPPARPFSCLECSRAFTRNENLERHKRTHHDGANIPRFECHKCHAQFARKDVCKRHSANCANRPALAPVEGQAPSQTAAEKQVVSAGAEANIDMNGVQDDGCAIQVEDISRQFEWPVDTDGVLGPAGWPSPGSDTHNLPAEVTTIHIQSYIAHFHPSLPIMHLPTMRTQSLPPILSKAIVAIGCLYSTSKCHSRDSGAEGRLSQDLWQSGCSELETFVKGNRRRLRTTWVLQSWILYIVYGTFTGDEKRITKAREMYRFLTDAIRDFEMLHKKSIFPLGSTWDADLGLSIPSAEVHRRWQLFIDQESVKLSLYAFYYLDYHLFASFNMRPMISSIEFEWDLPLAASLWEAESATEWWHTILQRQLHLESSRNDLSIPDDEAQVKSVMAATQFLLSKTASPRLLLALASSPFATLCIVANIENLVRDFTRCYYQLPPALADPSPFHVLTQVQNAQVSTALVLILSIVTENVCISCNSKCTSLWHAVRMGCLSIRISLCKPDDLLVGGIIEGNPAAGLATSVHLSLGNHVSTRRSGSNRQCRKPIAEDGFVAILEDMLQAMHEMGTATIPQPWEAPWTTIQGFKILIILWQALRFSIAELQSQDSPTPSLDKYTKIYDPARIVVHAIITALDIYDPEEQHISHDSLSTLEGLDEVDDLETQFINWMKKICDRRDVWTIGHDMGQLLDEIRAMDHRAIELNSSSL